MEQSNAIAFDGYKQRRPQDSLLYKIVQENVDTFLAVAESDGRYLPKRVKTELEKFLECGVLACGFMRVVCETCDKETLVPFSCKKRGFCPSCCGRRMSEVAIHLIDNVIPDVPVRQYVLSLPIALRYWCASNPKLLNAIHRIARDAVAEYVMAKSDRDDGEPGILTFVQRFGSALNLNIHFHMIVVEGVFVEKSTGRVKFYDILSPTDGEICDLVTHISNKMIKLLRKRGYLDEEGLASADLPEDKLLEDNPVQAHAMAASVQLKIGLGPNAGKSVRRIGSGFGHENEDSELTAPRCAQAHGFSLHANVFIDKGNRDKLGRLIKYTARPPLKSESLAINQNGDVVLKLKKRWNDGSTAVVYSPIEFLEKLVALIPPYRSHLLRYSGAFSPHSRLRGRVVPQPAVEAAPVADAKQPYGPKPKIKSGRIPWARLLRRCFQIDIEVCPHCNGKTRVIAALFSRVEVSRFLTHMGLEASPPRRFAARMPTLFSVD